MTMDQDVPVTFLCPRCKSPMYKPNGSVLYWHADTKHPACSITNIPDAAPDGQPVRELEAQGTSGNAFLPPQALR
ncbi:hypothetical protein [Ktedonobacter racemifer]|uniref:Uncharacterized protein n=1 Tax=Ktedonobacter racemifer DSM 44963 TaxID=485913 RepID=D6TJG0_KTERA|nr:hypothetical protein [Ktedonobacter racemifer]EFH89567.1 hypothetical protein Krac_11132 [Ktedonobacter racemifer DSM 44963]